VAGRGATCCAVAAGTEPLGFSAFLVWQRGDQFEFILILFSLSSLGKSGISPSPSDLQRIHSLSLVNNHNLFPEIKSYCIETRIALSSDPAAHQNDGI